MADCCLADENRLIAAYASGQLYRPYQTGGISIKTC